MRCCYCNCMNYCSSGIHFVFVSNLNIVLITHMMDNPTCYKSSLPITNDRIIIT